MRTIFPLDLLHCQYLSHRCYKLKERVAVMKDDLLSKKKKKIQGFGVIMTSFSAAIQK